MSGWCWSTVHHPVPLPIQRTSPLGELTESNKDVEYLAYPANATMTRCPYLRHQLTRGRVLYRCYRLRKQIAARLHDIRSSDAKANSDTAPPEGESIKLVCLWAAEFYSPAYTDDLIDSFRKLGWSRDARAGSGNPILWLEDSHRSGMVNLGVITPQDSEHNFSPTHTVQLPEDVTRAYAYLFTVNPCLNSVVVCFEFGEDTQMADIYSTSLDTFYRTQVIRNKQGWEYHRPRNQKYERINQIRQNLSNEALLWFKEHLPGLCAAGLLHGEMPTWECVTTRMAEPFERSTSVEYIHILGIGNEHDVWRHETLPSLKLRLSFEHRKPPRYHSVVAVQEPIVGNGLLDSDRPLVQQLYSLTMHIAPWLNEWGIVVLLEGYVQHIRKIRDPLRLRSRRHLRPITLLEMVQSNITFSADMSAVVNELLSEHRRGVLLDGNFLPCDTFLYQDRTLAEILSGIIRENAKWIDNTDRNLREQLSQFGSAMGAVENFRLQRAIRRLTWLLTVIAIVTVVLTVCYGSG